MNILLSCAGRQVFLINAFKEALNGKGKVFASDSNSTALSLEFADRGFLAPAFTSKNYIPWIKKTCKENKIDLLITLNVEDLLVLEKNRQIIMGIGCLLIGGKLNVIEQTYDKLKLFHFCQDIGLIVPETFFDKEVFDANPTFPLLAKPRFGKGSRGHKLLYSLNELYNFFQNINLNNTPYIFQEYIKGQEYGLDIINDFNSIYAATLVRKKVAMKNGETFEAVTQSSDEWEGMTRKISKVLSHQGTVDIDLIKSGDKQYIIDINHRFGGGYIFSHLAGVNLPKAYINWAKGMESCEEYLKSKNNVHGKRHGLNVLLVNHKI